MEARVHKSGREKREIAKNEYLKAVEASAYEVAVFLRISRWRITMTTNIKLLAQMFAAVFGCATLGFGQQCGQNPGSVDKFKDNLARDGFLVRDGRAQKFDPVQNYCAGLLPNALYGNKGAPYVAALVPDSPRGEAPTPLPPEFRLAPDEAVVMIGLTPPSEQYFSYQIYLSHRLYPPKTQPDFLLNSLGDSVNLRTIQTIGPDPFKRPLVLVFTPDKDIEARVRDALRGADYPTSITNTVVIPSSMLKLGLGATSDTFLIAHRNALFTDPNAGDLYIANPTLRVFRVTPKNTATSNPFPTPPLRVRGTGRTEMDLAPALARLHQAILSFYGGLTATEYYTQPIANEGYDYTQRGAITLGDTRDALYLGSGYLPDYGLTEDKLKLGNDDFLIAYGLNHVALGKGTYTNINVYGSETAKLALGSVFSPDLKGSAYPYLGPGDPAADLMYAYKISRNCGENEPFCLPLKAPDQCSVFTLDSNTLLGIAFRIYLEPSTKIGPAYPEILYDRIIRFSPNP